MASQSQSQSQSPQQETQESPEDHPHFLVPSPVPTRRNRTFSQTERAKLGILWKGKILSFCRQKGHGFIRRDEDGEKLFVHISDIDGEYVPLEGDEVTFRTVQIPPRNEKMQACHVVISHLKPGVMHERWDSPVSSSGSGDS